LRTKYYVASLLATFAASSVVAELSPNGLDFQVNQTTPGDQLFPDVAADAAGRFVVVWQDSTSIWDVRARRFASSGAPLGPDFLVNTYTDSHQKDPAVAADSEGAFVVVWMSYGSLGSDNHLGSIQARFYNSNGVPLGPEVQVNSYTPDMQQHPAVSAAAPGEFIVVWASERSEPPESLQSVQAQRYSVDGAPIGGNFRVDMTLDARQHPSVAADPTGNFVVTWVDSSQRVLGARQFLSGGTPVGPDFVVNAYDDYSSAAYPDIAANEAGEFVISWDELPAVHARFFDSQGSPVDLQIQVNSEVTGGARRDSEVLPVPGGDFIVLWESLYSSGTDVDGASIQTRRFTAEGVPVDSDSQVNSNIPGHQANPAAAVDGGGNLVVVWHSQSSSGTDNSGYSIQARRFDNLFRDGFESGSTSRWSSVNP